MKKFVSGFAILACTMLVAAGGAQAAACEGVYARKSAKPTVLHKGDDGSTLMLVRSTGSVTRKAAGGSPLSPAWQHCLGLWTVKADKSGSGSGHCYNVHSNGDQEMISWEGANGGGTWQGVGGTGKFANNQSDKGTWKTTKVFSDGTITGAWEGECAE